MGSSDNGDFFKVLKWGCFFLRKKRIEFCWELPTIFFSPTPASIKQPALLASRINPLKSDTTLVLFYLY